jgi:hypothetical protein
MIPRQVYIGRVIAPAKFYAGKGNKKSFITFTLSVANLASVKGERGYEKTSAKITCSYTVQSDTDMVATVLSNISTKDDPKTVGSGSYKSVEVLVEGNERLVQVLNEDGSPGRGYYKNLDFCLVTILDSNVKKLFKEDRDSAAAEEDSSEDVPKVAPTKSRTVVVKKQEEPVEEVEASSEYEVGEVITDPVGQEFKYLGGDPSDMASWEKVVKATPVAKKTPPFLNPKKVAAKQNQTDQALADEEDLEASNLFMAVAKGKNVAV